MSPFKSKAQAAKFASLEKQGKIAKGTTAQWAAETREIANLPDRVAKRAPKAPKVGVIKRRGK
jgi:hypothetical protein